MGRLCGPAGYGTIVVVRSSFREVFVFKFSVLLLVAGTSALAASPASAATKSCGTVKGVGNRTAVTKVATSAGSCPSAKAVAKHFARTRVAPAGYTCKEKLTPPTPTVSARVTCRRTGRTITFKVVWNGSMPLPAAPALPVANG